MLTRYSGNPILVADKGSAWRDVKVYNCAIHKDSSNIYQMLFRAVGYDWISRIGYAESSDGIHFKVDQSAVLKPWYTWEVKGCEDPRIVKIDDNFWVSYTAFDGKTARAALTASKDLKQFGARKLLFRDWRYNARTQFTPDWSKGAAIFSEKINGRYYMLFGDSHIWNATSTNLIDWVPNITPVLTGRPGEFDAAYVETGPPPIKTDYGWLVIYHGIDTYDVSKTYRIGAALFDKTDPTKVIWRSKQPLLEPSEPYEKVGFVDVIDGGFDTLKKLTLEDLHELSKREKLPKAVFCCGAVKEHDNLIRLYYGAGDTVICTATVDLQTILSS